jgi:vacuolar protein sorting-associated protein 45
METLADMKRFVEEYPEFKKLGGNVAKHVSLVGELSRIIERDELLSVSELEQSLAANESHAADYKVSLYGPSVGRGDTPWRSC